jgi:hypothetical protein
MLAGSEAPSEMLWYIEEKKLIESAEDVTHTLHNTYCCAGRKFVNRCRGRNISTPPSCAGATRLNHYGPAPLADLG